MNTGAGFDWILQMLLSSLPAGADGVCTLAPPPAGTDLRFRASWPNGSDATRPNRRRAVVLRISHEAVDDCLITGDERESSARRRLAEILRDAIAIALQAEPDQFEVVVRKEMLC
jgi:hypothetical protein